MRKKTLLLPLVIALAGFWHLSAQNLQLQLPDTIALPGDTLLLGIKAANFDEIVSVQFSITWDPSVISYMNTEVDDLTNAAVGETDAEDGLLRFSWFDIQGLGLILPDGSNLVNFSFEVVGEMDDYTDFVISGVPLAVQIFRATNTPGVFEPVALEQDSGSVTITDEIIEEISINVAIDKEDNPCFGDEEGFINLDIITNASDVDISWTGPGTFSASVEDIDQLAAGDYEVAIMDTMGVLLFDTTITISQPVAVLEIESITADTTNCNENTGSAQITVSGGTEPYSYDIGNGPTDNPQFNDLEAAAYSVSITDANGCMTLGSFEVNSPPIPEVDLGSDLSLCEGEVVSLDAGLSNNYLWSTGATEGMLEVDVGGEYSVTITNEFGCTASDTIQVLFGAGINLQVENDQLTICPGDSVQLVASGADTYEWIDTSASLSATDIANPFAFPIYTSSYIVMASNDCAEAMVSLEVEILPVSAAAGPDTCIAVDTEARLSASGGIDYMWIETPYPVSDVNSREPTTEPKETATYVVLITEANGCQVRDSLNVLVANDPAVIKGINLITPNGDGKNDVLEFQELAKFNTNTLRVYNRWGTLIYQKLNYQSDGERFDGTYKGKQLSAGNYFYILTLQSYELRQTLTIVRE